MVKRLPVVVAVLALAAPLAAAERQGTDLFAGYSFSKVDDVSRHGGNLALGFDLFGPIDGFVDASAHWGSAESTSIDDLTLMAGPGVRFGKRGGTLVFARVLAGLVKDRTSITVLDVDISESRSGFGLLAGGGVDVPITATSYTVAPPGPKPVEVLTKWALARLARRLAMTFSSSVSMAASMITLQTAPASRQASETPAMSRSTVS